MADHIFIRDLQVEMIIGILPHERETPQPVVINVKVFTDTRVAGDADDLSASIDYAALAADLQAYCAGHQPLTVEALAEALAGICLERPQASAAQVQVEKPQAVTGAGSVGVLIERGR